MESSFLSDVGLPLAIIIIMITMGMTLTITDFRRVLSEPKQIGVGLLCQLVLLPLIGFAVAFIFPLDAVFAISIILLAAAPGGTTSNLITHAAEGDRALSVSLTAISNSIVWLTLPFLLSIAFRVFGDGSQAIENFPIVDTMVQVAVLTIVPVIIGMTIRHFQPAFCERVKEGSKIFATVFFAVIVIVLVIQERATIMEEGPRFAIPFIVMNAVALAVGYFVAKGFGIGQKQAATIGIETGLQNSTLAITIALSILNSSEMTIIPGLYGVWMLFTGLIFAFSMTRGTKSAKAIAA